MKNILVTGGAGFIGSNFIRYILDKHKDCSVTCLDKLTYSGNIENLKDLQNNKRFKFVKGDICDRKDYDSLRPETIINFAAESHVDRSILEPADFWKTNVEGTKSLLEFAKDVKVELFVQISTDEVYGSIEKGKFNEGSPADPTSDYSKSKLEADKVALEYSKYFKIIITRTCNNVGPYQYPEKVIPLFITNALEGKALPLYGDGLNAREWIYVLDNCEAIDFLARKQDAPEGIYNISSERETTNLALTKKILKKLNKPEDLMKFVKDRPGHDRRYAIECEKIKALGWKCENDIDSALDKTIQWYLDNKDWWNNIKAKKEYTDYYKKQYGERL